MDNNDHFSRREFIQRKENGMLTESANRAKEIFELTSKTTQSGGHASIRFENQEDRGLSQKQFREVFLTGSMHSAV